MDPVKDVTSTLSFLRHHGRVTRQGTKPVTGETVRPTPGKESEKRTPSGVQPRTVTSEVEDFLPLRKTCQRRVPSCLGRRRVP